MKKGIIIWSTLAVLATGGLYGYNLLSEPAAAEVYSGEPNQYCAKMRDGKMVVLFEGKEIGADVFLKNGTTIKVDGTLITKDGVRSSLKEGECIDPDGNKKNEKMNEPY